MKKQVKHVSLFDVVNTILVVLITLLILYPLYFCLVASFSDPAAVAQGKTLLWVRDFTTEAYKNMIQDSRIWVGYRNTIFYTFFGTLYCLVLTIPAAYVLSKKWLPGRTMISWYFFITMYVGGGMIPTYMLIRDLGLIDNPLVMIVGTGVSCYNLIVTRQYFSNSIPEELYDAAYIDGASEGHCFTRIALPLAKPIVAVMTLYYAVGQWNSYYNALLYIRREKYFPLQLVLRNIIASNKMAAAGLGLVEDTSLMEYLIQKAHMAEGMKYAVILIASLPMLILYPFIQKYFTKGVMIGAVKG